MNHWNLSSWRHSRLVITNKGLNFNISHDLYKYDLLSQKESSRNFSCGSKGGAPGANAPPSKIQSNTTETALVTWTTWAGTPSNNQSNKVYIRIPICINHGTSKQCWDGTNFLVKSQFWNCYCFKVPALSAGCQGFSTRFSGDYLHFCHFGHSSVPFRYNIDSESGGTWSFGIWT